MPKGICYNANRQERRKCSLWHAKSPGVATIGKKDESAHCGTQKAPELRPPGLFYSVVARWLMP